MYLRIGVDPTTEPLHRWRSTYRQKTRGVEPNTARVSGHRPNLEPKCYSKRQHKLLLFCSVSFYIFSQTTNSQQPLQSSEVMQTTVTTVQLIIIQQTSCIKQAALARYRPWVPLPISTPGVGTTTESGVATTAEAKDNNSHHLPLYPLLPLDLPLA